MTNPTYQGTGQLPKFLVEKLGKSVVKAAIAKGVETYPRDLILKHPERAIVKHPHVPCGGGLAKTKANTKWKRIRDGKIPPDKLYDGAEAALEAAGL